MSFIFTRFTHACTRIVFAIVHNHEHLLLLFVKQANPNE